MYKVAVLLSSYNGEKYIEEQINSILEQTYLNIDIYVRDDGSTDKTLDILRKYEKDNKIKLVVGQNLGFVNSFFELMKLPKDAEYFAFSDQDDIWEKDKIERAVNILKKQKDNIPIMYYSNYDLYDEKMKFKKHSLKRDNHSFCNSLVECVNVGMVTMLNKEAKKIILNNLPNNCLGHDWWCYMVCQTFGDVIYDDYISCKHRSHENNVSEVGKSFIRLQIFRIKSLLRNNYFKTIKCQIEDFKKYFYKELSDENKKIIDMFYIKGFKLNKQLKKLFYKKRFRNVLSDEIIIRFMFLIGAI